MKRTPRAGRILAALALAALASAAALAAPSPARSRRDKERPMKSYSKPPLEELRRRLSPEQFAVTQEGDTEPAFQNAYWNEHRDGLYVDVATGEPLFSSRDKFDSGTGWPSFTRPVAPGALVEKEDRSFFTRRVEVRSRAGGSHLGHVFPDGPKPTGLRYCINSAALRFIPAQRLEAEGYPEQAEAFRGADKAAAAGRREEAYLAGGCFWGMQHLLRRVPGVLSTEAGYTGGRVRNATYRDHEGHAEAVRVVFDPGRLGYEQLLRWYFRIHDPTTMNRQGNDRGTSYRSAIFYKSEEQRRAAEALKERLNRRGRFGAPLVTEIAPAGEFWRAEPEHQDYLERLPDGYTCHFLRPESILGD